MRKSWNPHLAVTTSDLEWHSGVAGALHHRTVHLTGPGLWTAEGGGPVGVAERPNKTNPDL